jgi:phosphohistidine phosphatase
MKLVLIRHAEAKAIGEDGIATDFDRSLTEHGKSQAAAMAKALAERGLCPDVILASPYVRAMETATIVAAVLTPDRLPVVNEFLRLEEMRPRKLTAALPAGKRIVLVGHMPDLAQYAGWLLGCSNDAIDFEKGAAACLAFGKSAGKGQGELRWLVSPEWLGVAAAS